MPPPPLRLIETPSPNHGPRPAGVTVDMLVLHYTGMATAEGALARLCDPVAQVSAHYTVTEDAVIHAHVAEHRRAWQAGASHWRGADDVNSRSIGIEIVNPGHEWGLAPFPDAQVTAVIALCREIMGRHPISPGDVVAHSDVAPDRKADPGELFPWRRLARAGVGLWPPPDLVADPIRPEDGLRALGYGVDLYGARLCLNAFQRRFRPARIDGVVDAETVRRIGQVLRMASSLP